MYTLFQNVLYFYSVIFLYLIYIQQLSLFDNRSFICIVVYIKRQPFSLFVLSVYYIYSYFTAQKGCRTMPVLSFYFLWEFRYTVCVIMFLLDIVSQMLVFIQFAELLFDLCTIWIDCYITR